MEHTNQSNLLPCPFCGEKPYRTESVNGTNMLYVGCSACGVEMKAAKMLHPGRWEWSKDIETAWNRRSQNASV